jgi:hypothetical protein
LLSADGLVAARRGHFFSSPQNFRGVFLLLSAMAGLVITSTEDLT